MNAKETVIQMIKSHQAESVTPEIYNDLITAVESAIFEVPSEDEMVEELTEKKALKNNFIDLNAYAIGISESRNYILNYKKQ